MSAKKRLYFPSDKSGSKRPQKMNSTPRSAEQTIESRRANSYQFEKTLSAAKADARVGLFQDRKYYSHQAIESIRLTQAQEQELFAQLKANPDDAKVVEQIVRSYLFFALRQARKDMGRRTVEARMKCGLAEDDAISAANLGLMRAIRRFDAGRGARFTTYAGWWIKKALSEARYDVHAIKVPSGDRKRYSQFAKMKREGVSSEDIAAILEVTLYEVERILSLPSGRQDSFDSEVPLEYAAEVIDSEEAERGEHEELLQKLEAAKMKLGIEELGIVHDRFSRNMSLAEIGKARGMSSFLVKERLQTILHVLKITLSN